jgi:hypothetical protein
MRTRHQHGLPRSAILALRHAEMMRWWRYEAALVGGAPPGIEKCPGWLGRGISENEQTTGDDPATIGDAPRMVNREVVYQEGADAHHS